MIRQSTKKQLKRQAPKHEDSDDHRMQVETQLKVALTLFQLSKSINPEQYAEVLPALQNIEFFQTSCPETMTQEHFIKMCISNLRYQHIPKGNMVFHYGEHGDKFYIILGGVAQVLVQKSKEKLILELQQREEFWETLRSKKPDLPPLSEIDVAHDERVFCKLQARLHHPESVVQLENSLLALNRHQLYFTHSGICRFQEVAQLFAGKFFGEMALTTNQPRTASILAKSDLHVIYLKKAEFKQIFEKAIRDLHERLDFFQRVFNSIDHYNVSRIMQYFTEVTYLPNHYVWKENEPFKGFLLMRTGWIQLEVLMEEKSKRALDAPKNIVMHVRRQRIILSTHTSGQFVGQNYIIKQLGKYPTSCLTLEQTTAFQTVKKMFPELLQFLETSSSETKEALFLNASEIKQRLSHHQKKTYDRVVVKDLDYRIRGETESSSQTALVRSHQKGKKSKDDIVDFNERQHRVLEDRSASYGVNPEFNMHYLDPNYRKNIDLLVSKYFHRHSKKPDVPKLVKHSSTEHLRKLSLNDTQTLNESFLCRSIYQSQPAPAPFIEPISLLMNKLRTTQGYLHQKKLSTMERYFQNQSSEMDVLSKHNSKVDEATTKNNSKIDIDPNIKYLQIAGPSIHTSTQTPNLPTITKFTKLKNIVQPFARYSSQSDLTIYGRQSMEL